jgi:predicted nuclease of restriction endonuclease-like (RecB) superfamily
MTEINKNSNYVADIKQMLLLARQKTYSVISATMVETYWQIGKRIVEEEQNGKERANYGESILKNLSIALNAEFGKGFSYANLRNFRQFYLTYPNPEICYTVCSKLTWSHNRLIMRVDNLDARNYYLNECISQNWSVRLLERHIHTSYYQRILSTSQDISSEKLNETDDRNITDFIKDPYVFEFLNFPLLLKETENTIETALINHLQQFLLELGKGFSFVARQFRISTETNHFFIDLVFYNYILKCFVIFDLKTTKLTHQDVGQLDMYVRMFDDLKKQADDNPTIGILLCAEKDETVVKYSVLSDKKQLFATKYMTYLPTEQELKALIEHDRLRFELDNDETQFGG